MNSVQLWYRNAREKIGTMPRCECGCPAVEHWHTGDDGRGGFRIIEDCVNCKKNNCAAYRAVGTSSGGNKTNG